MADLKHYLELAVKDGASDLFIVAGGPVCCKAEGKILPLSEGRVLPDDTAALIREI